MNFGACDDLSGDSRGGHFMRYALRCSKYGEGFFEVIADIFISLYLMFFM